MCGSGIAAVIGRNGGRSVVQTAYIARTVLRRPVGTGIFFGQEG
jgi:hypothetical protein